MSRLTGNRSFASISLQRRVMDERYRASPRPSHPWYAIADRLWFRNDPPLKCRVPVVDLMISADHKDTTLPRDY